MYKKRGCSNTQSIQEILARLQGTTSTESVEVYVPVVYAQSDIVAAKTVLERLLATAAANAVPCVELANVTTTEKVIDEQ